MKDLLAKVELLKDLGGDAREQLAEHFEERRLDQGRALFRMHDEAEELYLVAEGQLRLELSGEPVGTLGPGDVVGAASLVVIGRRECSAIAQTPVRVFTLTRESYLRLRLEQPQVALVLQEGILRELAHVVRASLPEFVRITDGT